jgi:peroxiredoxin
MEGHQGAGWESAKTAGIINFMFSARGCLFTLAVIVAAGAAYAGTDTGLEKSAATSSKSPTVHAVNGKKANSLSLMGLDGMMHSLEDWKGKVVVLNFWATWCSPCLSEIPDFVAYQEQFKTRGLQIVGVGIDDEKKLRNVQRTLEINYPILVADPKKNDALIESWGNKSGIVPYSVVIDRNGRVAFAHQGQIDRDSFNENILPLLDSI